MARHRLRLFGLGFAMGVGLWLLGGVAVVPQHAPDEKPTVVLAPWLAAHVCQYETCSSVR